MSHQVGTRNSEAPSNPENKRAEEFAARYSASFRVLWLIAVGVVGDADLAEDVVQEAGMIALEKLDRFEPGSDFTAWVGCIVRNVARNRARKERVRRTTSLDPALIDQASPSKFDGKASAGLGESHHPASGTLGIGDGDLGERVIRALAGVSDVARACLLLRTIEEMEYSRIARLLEIPEGTAMSHVHRTRRFLRERLADAVSDLPGSKEPKR